MDVDFTPETYKRFLSALKAHHCYRIMHDIDRYPNRALVIANIEAEVGLSVTYYFRITKESYDENIIQQIVSMGHTVGYHYECLTTCNGDIDAAYEDFCQNLDKLRKIVPVTTACAHGSPRSPWNSQYMWETSRRQVNESTRQQDFETSSLRDIHALGIEYEPMLDTDFSKTLYLTDTGRRWDGYKVSVRDKVPQYQEQWEKEGLVFHTTDDIIQALRNPEHPIHKYDLLINTHPQRWMPFGLSWLKEATLQNIKNIAKRIIVLNQK